MIQINEFETLSEAREDDLLRSGLKLGDIIKIRRLLKEEEDSLNSSGTLDSSFSSLDASTSSLSEQESSAYLLPKPAVQVVQVSFINCFPRAQIAQQLCSIYIFS